jgi:hypothetical protein
LREGNWGDGEVLSLCRESPRHRGGGAATLVVGVGRWGLKWRSGLREEKRGEREGAGDGAVPPPSCPCSCDDVSSLLSRVIVSQVLRK